MRKLTRRGLRGVKLVVSDAHEGIKAAIAKVLHATWQRCRVHFARNVLAYAGRSGRRVVSAFIATAFAQDDGDAAKIQWRKVADQLTAIYEIVYVVLTAGSFDLLIEVVCEDDDRLLGLLNDHVRSIPAVRSTETFVYLKLAKQTYAWGAR